MQCSCNCAGTQSSPHHEAFVTQHLLYDVIRHSSSHLPRKTYAEHVNTHHRVKGGESLSSTTLAYDEEQKKLRQSLLQSIDAHDANKSSSSSSTTTKSKKSKKDNSTTNANNKAANSDDSSDDDVLQVTINFNKLMLLNVHVTQRMCTV
jgi:hypothetical protein